MNKTPLLRHHRLKHFDVLEVSDLVLRRRYARGCSMSNCRGRCCGSGVDVDLTERDRILSSADTIQSLMDTEQEKDSSKWFGDTFEDPDFPSGCAISTRLYGGTCVFLDSKGLCVLHKAELRGRPEIGELKPFFCRAYPLCIEDGVLTLDDKPCPTEMACCGAVESGSLTIFDICEYELEYVLGADGLAELRHLSSNVERSGDPLID